MNAVTIDVSVNQRDADPLSSAAPIGQGPNHETKDVARSNLHSEDDNGEGNDTEFTPARDHSPFRSFQRYARSVLALFSACVLDLTNANNKTVVSWIIRIFFTIITYGTIYTNSTGLLLWAIAYLLDHRWYLLAVTCSVVLIFLCAMLLAFYEWMWQWQGRSISLWCSGSDNRSSSGYNVLRSVNILDDDDMEDNLTLRGWAKEIFRALVSCLIWSVYCIVNVKIDFWITEQYIVARPTYYVIELRLINCLEAAPILFGAALLLNHAYPNLLYRNFSREYISGSPTITGTVDTFAEPFASSEELDSERYLIVVDEDNEARIGVGMQNLII